MLNKFLLIAEKEERIKITVWAKIAQISLDGNNFSFSITVLLEGRSEPYKYLFHRTLFTEC